MEHDVESERVNMMHVSEMHTLSKVNQYIAGVPMTGGVYGKDGSVYDFTVPVWPCWGPSWTGIVGSISVA